MTVTLRIRIPLDTLKWHSFRFKRNLTPKEPVGFSKFCIWDTLAGRAYVRRPYDTT